MRFARFSFFALSLLPLAASQTECLPNDNAVLRAAITDYIESGGNLNPNSDAAMRYGFPIGTWCVDNVEDFSFAFQGFTEFDESLENWNTESAVDMSFMFVNAEAYNQPMANWDVSQVADAEGMFSNARSFNQDISGWQVDSLRVAIDMFSEAENFNQDMCAWGRILSITTRTTNMFEGTSCPEQGDPTFLRRPPGPFCFECFFEPTVSPTSAPTGMPAAPTVRPATASPTISLAPTTSPTMDRNGTIPECLREIKKQCNCGLYFAGSHCLEYVVENICVIPPEDTVEEFTELVSLSYDAFCEDCRRRGLSPNVGIEERLRDRNGPKAGESLRKGDRRRGLRKSRGWPGR